MCLCHQANIRCQHQPDNRYLFCHHDLFGTTLRAHIQSDRLKNSFPYQKKCLFHLACWWKQCGTALCMFVAQSSVNAKLNLNKNSIGMFGWSTQWVKIHVHTVAAVKEWNHSWAWINTTLACLCVCVSLPGQMMPWKDFWWWILILPSHLSLSYHPLLKDSLTFQLFKLNDVMSISDFCSGLSPQFSFLFMFKWATWLKMTNSTSKGNLPKYIIRCDFFFSTICMDGFQPFTRSDTTMAVSYVLYPDGTIKTSLGCVGVTQKPLTSRLVFYISNDWLLCTLSTMHYATK